MNRPRKIAVIVGTRPEAIKLAPVILAAREQAEHFDLTVVTTGQHREMATQMLNEFDVSVDVSLDVMRKDQTLAHITSSVVTQLYDAWTSSKPDVVVVQGDTTTTFAAALAAFYHRIDVGHVEAGLRTGDRFQPFPEEINRRLTTHLATHHFAPTESARSNLLKEGVDSARIWVTGNTSIDALLFTKKKIQPARDSLRGSRLLLLTVHRRENHGEPLRAVCSAIERLLATFEDLEVLCPVHPNPNVEPVIRERLGSHARVQLVAPLGYMAFVEAMNRAEVILTDSGGIQEEAPSLRKPVLVLRNTTERPEAVDAGTTRLVGTDENTIVSSVTQLLTQPETYRRMANGQNPYGDGKASQRILEALRM